MFECAQNDLIQDNTEDDDMVSQAGEDKEGTSSIEEDTVSTKQNIIYK